MEGSTRGGAKTVLLLGGYGRAGLPIAERLLEETDVRILVAGRDGARAVETATKLNAGRAEARVEGMRVDAANAASLAEAFERCDLVTVCVPPTVIGSRVIAAALAAGIDYVGINAEAREQASIEALSDRVERAGLRVLTDAGLVPGIPAVLARWAATRFDRVEEVTVGALMRDDSLSPGSAIDLIAATGIPPVVYEFGEWRHASLTGTRRIDFGPPFGACTCYPTDLPELRPLPERLGLQRAGTYVAGVNGFVNALAAVWLLLGLGRWSWGVRLGAKLLVPATRRTRPPFRTVVTLETLGEVEGGRQRLRVAVDHADGYIATAIPTVACLLQVLDGTVDSGVQMMGHAVDVDCFMRDLERLGMKPTVTSTPV